MFFLEFGFKIWVVVRDKIFLRAEWKLSHSGKEQETRSGDKTGTDMKRPRCCLESRLVWAVNRCSLARVTLYADQYGCTLSCPLFSLQIYWSLSNLRRHLCARHGQALCVQWPHKTVAGSDPGFRFGKEENGYIEWVEWFQFFGFSEWHIEFETLATIMTHMVIIANGIRNWRKKVEPCAVMLGRNVLVIFMSCFTPS